MKLSIIVPAHNEELRIRPFLDVYTTYFAEHYGDDHELIIVVNGSTDDTADMVRAYMKNWPYIHLIEIPGKVGKGGALMRGFPAARGELIGFVDADGATPPKAFQDLVEHIGEAGCIIASRWLPGSDVQPRQPFSRRIASRLFNSLVRLFFAIPITDTQCGAKLMRRDALLAVLPRLGLTRWAFDVDLLFQLRRAGYAIIERPTVWHDVKGSKVRIARASTEMALALTRLRLIHSPLHGLVTLYDHTLGRIIHLNI